jgi:acyl carrier protein
MMIDELETRIRNILADILGIEPRQVDEGTAFDRTPGWDSVNHINLVVALEEEFSIRLDVAEIETMLAFPDVVTTVESKL